jgi:CRISPR-associated protein Cas1
MPEDASYFDLPDQHLEGSPDRTSDGKLPVRLTPDALKRVISAFEKKMNAEFYHAVAEKTVTYAEAMAFQAMLYRRIVEGETADYQPLLLK